MKVINKTKVTYQESTIDADGNVKFINLEPGKVAEVSNEIAEKWLKINGIEEFVDPEAAKAKENELKAEIEKLKAENTQLKAPKPAAKTRTRKK